MTFRRMSNASALPGCSISIGLIWPPSGSSEPLDSAVFQRFEKTVRENLVIFWQTFERYGTLPVFRPLERRRCR